jgi:hypothetical protein
MGFAIHLQFGSIVGHLDVEGTAHPENVETYLRLISDHLVRLYTHAAAVELAVPELNSVTASDLEALTGMPTIQDPTDE